MESLPGNLTGGARDNTSNQTDPFGRNEDIAKIEITVLTVTFLVAVVGNVSVLLAMSRTPRKRSRVHLFIKHLSLADLMVAFFQVLPQLCWEITFRFYGPDILCRVVKHLQVLGMFASTYMMVMMTLDRYIAICHPMQTLQQPTRRAYIMIASTWLCSLALSLPQYLIFSLSEVTAGSEVYDCWGHFVQPWGVRAYITWITTGIFLVPVTVLVLCYGFICRAIWRNVQYKTRKGPVGAGVSNGHRTNGLLGKSSVSSISTISRAKLRTVKMTFVIVVAYVVCWAPFFIVQMWSVWDETFSYADSENTAVALSALLASLNSCCNPWIYMLFSGHLLGEAARCLPCRRRSSLGRRAVAGQQDSDSSVRRTTLLSWLQGPRLSEPFTCREQDLHPQGPRLSEPFTCREQDLHPQGPRLSEPFTCREQDVHPQGPRLSEPFTCREQDLHPQGPRLSEPFTCREQDLHPQGPRLSEPFTCREQDLHPQGPRLSEPFTCREQDLHPQGPRLSEPFTCREQDLHPQAPNAHLSVAPGDLGAPPAGLVVGGPAPVGFDA